MVSVRRLVSAWFGLSLSVSVGVQALAVAVRDAPGSSGAFVVFGAAVAFVAAYAVCRQFPDVKTSVLWVFSGLTLVLFVAGNLLVPNGFYADAGERSVAVVGLLWVGAAAVSYGALRARRAD